MLEQILSQNKEMVIALQSKLKSISGENDDKAISHSHTGALNCLETFGKSAISQSIEIHYKLPCNRSPWHINAKEHLAT